ncbi:putative odorant-binding protein A10 [Microplitis demolitor]|uniref:putative odorant-binding protein A10 n=1 Tax=Microplitis demolitor TaxID=69319 RepID=UPI0004CCE427|nr:putative odorant-binding protein A10 [Microplitis demolitor]
MDLKIFILVLMCAGIGFAQEKLYSDKYDYIDVDGILNNARQRESYYKCFAGTGPCITADAKFFRDHFPEAIVTNCRRCTKKQLASFDKITDWYTTHELDKYNALVAMAIKKYSKN